MSLWSLGDGQDAAPKPLTPTEIRQAIAELGDPQYLVRQRASQRLWQAGATAEHALAETVAGSTDYETVFRARQILDRLHWGITPDTPPRTVELIERFRRGNSATRHSVCRELAAEGNTVLLQRLIALETDPRQRDALALNYLRRARAAMSANADYQSGLARRRSPRTIESSAGGDESARPLPVQLAEGDLDAVQQQLLPLDDEASLRDYAALLLARGTLGAKLAALRAQLKESDTAGQQRLLFLLRAKGDLAGAAAVAKKLPQDNLRIDLLGEMRDWAELARLTADADLDKLAQKPWSVEELARTATYYRLGGRRQRFEAAVAAIVKIGQTRKPEPMLAAAALLLNDRADDGIEVELLRNPADAFSVLCAQRRFREAFQRAGLRDVFQPRPDWAAWLASPAGADRSARLRLACKVAGMLHFLGEDEKAEGLLAALRRAPSKGATDIWNLMDLEIRLRHSDGALEQAARYIAASPGSAGAVFYTLFKNEPQTAQVLWPLIRKEYPQEEILAALGRLKRLLAADLHEAAAATEFRRLIKRVDRPATEGNDKLAPNPLVTIGALLLARGQTDMALECADQASREPLSSAALVQLGDLFFAAKHWYRAARAYEDAWTKEPGNAAALFLLGQAEHELAEAALASRHRQAALILPLGNAERRYQLIKVLERLGLKDEATRQRKLTLRVGPVGRAGGEWYVGDALQSLRIAAMASHDYAAAAEYQQRAILGLLRDNVFCLDFRNYLQLPWLLHVTRAKGFLQAGKFAEAAAEAAQAEALIPGDDDFLLEIVPELEKHGRKAESEVLVERALQRYEQACNDFPRSAPSHNDAAWLLANLNRDLAKALAHAKRAVELQPRSAAYNDTLAEVDFRRGDRAEAIRREQSCVALDPKNPFYRKQLDRFQGK